MRFEVADIEVAISELRARGMSTPLRVRPTCFRGAFVESAVFDMVAA